MAVGPVFVLGAARSGTSIAALGLSEGAGLGGYRESQVFPLLARLLSQIQEYFAGINEKYLEETEAHFIAKLDRFDVEKRIAQVFLEIHEEEFGQTLWFDKTPTSAMIYCAPLLAELYPDAKFIFMKRRGIENLLSRQRKFPDAPFEDLCNEWAGCMQAWQGVKAGVSDRSVEVDQVEIALRPESVVEKVGALLELNHDQQAGVLDVWAKERPEQTAIPRESVYQGLEDTGWSPEEQALFKERCGGMMAAFGYRLSGEIRDGQDEAAAIALFYPVTDVNIDRENVTEKSFSPTPGGFLLHPNQPGQAIGRITYRGIVFSGQNYFQVTTKLMNEKCGPVIFGLRVCDAKGGAELVSQSNVVQPGTSGPWRFSFDAIDGVCDIEIQTQMAPGVEEADGAWAIWLNPSFDTE